MKNIKVLLNVAVTFLVMGMLSTTEAAYITWSGAVDTAYTAGGNWAGGTVPSNNDWQDIARFAQTSPANKTPNLTVNSSVKAIDFLNSTGWNLSGSGKTLTLRSLSSTGSGVNTVSARLKSVYSGNTWNVGAGNTLTLSGGLYQDSGGSIINLTGGGILAITSRIDGWSSTLKMYINDGTLKISGATPYVNGGAVYIKSADSCLQLQTSVSAATTLIGSKIIDDVGNGLDVTDLGNGYVSISVTPLAPPISGSWDGTYGTDFENPGNWVDGAPANNDWQHTAIFVQNLPANKTPTLSINRSVKAIDFRNSTGWNLSGSGKTLTLRYLSSTGSGVNTVSAKLKSVYSGNTWNVGEGNTLTLSGGLYQDSGGSIINLSGGGILAITSRIDGWSSTLKMYINDGTLKISGSTPYVNGGAVYIKSADSYLQLQTSVSAATTLIGSKIIDDVGNGLDVTDLGNGYVQVSASSVVVDPPVSDPPESGNWTMIFEDNFDGNYLDPNNWRVGGHWLGIAGSAGNTPENIFVENGKLNITAEKRSIDFGFNSYSYASGEISTFQQFRQKYGYFEARIKYDAVTGVWPAFWTMPDRGSYGWVEGQRESLLRFDLSGISQPISSAELKLKVTAATANGIFHLYRLLSDNWDEDTVTWNNKPAYAPEWLCVIYSPIAGEELVIDVWPYVSLQLEDGENAGFAIADIYMLEKTLTLASKENTTASYRPCLVIDGVELLPEDDAYVRAGSYANDNFGNDSTMLIKDSWGNTSSTFNGGMEIDIMESLGIWGDNKTQHALHWDGYDSQHQSTGSAKLTLTPTSDGYHVYGLHWEPGRVAMYIDGIMTWEYINSRVCSVESYILLSLQMGGWDNNWNIDDANLPATMEVDYVRAWSRDIP